MVLDKFVEIANLFEIYSSLLSEKQKEYLEDHFENDLSLSEIAKNNNVSRQAIYDNIKRGIALLYDYEDKLKFYQIKKNIREELMNLKENYTKEKLEKIIENLL
ncbi:MULTISPECIES: YlxM family DNA-binding protein [Fusobacterium]|uniref:YlxM family DNA-binding protein n=1 Tax=Fusobacterium TaxID=848 RepID=UPI002A7F6CBA|nr:sigma factor-like helix-turn-helix DNA-binding protein [Fusobacterium sp.]